MKISNMQQQLEDVKKFFGDVEIEFWLEANNQSSSKELEFKKIHDGYNQSDSSLETVCEVKLST